MIDAQTDSTDSGGVSRRAVLLGVGTAGGVLGSGAIGALGGYALAGKVPAASGASAVTAAGESQAGINRPAVPQPHCLVVVADFETTDLAHTLSSLGTEILALTDGSGEAEVSPEGPGNLSITVGLGAQSLAATRFPALANDVRLPEFAGDAELEESRKGGGLLLSLNANDPILLEPALARLLQHLPGVQLRWSDFGYRGIPVNGVGRNPLGYFDGIIGPSTSTEFREDVWITEGPLAGGTIAVIRRFSLDVDRFRTLDAAARDAVIGRKQRSGAPLSGGVRDDQVNLDAKADNGDLLIPVHAHARAAHPSFTGSRLMLRRSYSYRTSDADRGVLFMSFQNDVQTFARTQLRLDEVDDLMHFAQPTATAAFAILPGFSSIRPLGAPLV